MEVGIQRFIGDYACTWLRGEEAEVIASESKPGLNVVKDWIERGSDEGTGPSVSWQAQ